MAQDPISLDALISHVSETYAADGPLDRLEAAATLSGRLGDVADHLIGHFVDQARHAGASWTEIGQHMGVSKQAAQKRFVGKDPDNVDAPPIGWLSRFTPRAREAVDYARSHAQTNAFEEVGTGHLLLGLLADPDGLAAQAVVALSGDPDRLRATIEAVAKPPKRSRNKRARYGRSAKKTLELAVREALRMQHNYIGTEHLLLGLLRQQGDTTNALLVAAGVTHDAVEAWVTDQRGHTEHSSGQFTVTILLVCGCPGLASSPA